METKEVRMEVSKEIQDKIKAHLDYWRGRPFEELEAHVLELLAKEAASNVIKERLDERVWGRKETEVEE